MLFDIHNIGNMAFKNFWLEVANKKPLYTQILPLHKLKFPVKKGIFLQLQNFVGLCQTILHREYITYCIEKWMSQKSYETDS